jgi:beta-glucosidase
VALIGPTADDRRLLLGDYHYPAHTEIVYRRDELAGDVTPGVGMKAAPKAFHAGPFYVAMKTPREALTDYAEVTYAPGCALDDDDTGGFADAVAAADAADVAVVCVGGRSGLLPECTSGEFRDASDLALTGSQQALVAEIAATGTPLVLVVIGGRNFTLGREVAASNAALLAWLPGEEGGTALARLLFGEANPAGRLPVSMPRAAGQVPTYYNHRSGGGRSMMLGDYADLPAGPLFPFGHGLSYARFEYQELSAPDTVDVHASINLWVVLRNVSQRAGDEVVQVYLHDKVADVARPVRKLVGFKRLTVPAGAGRRVKFVLDVSQLGYFYRGMSFVVDPGEVELLVGASSRDIQLRKTVTILGERRPLQQQQVVATQAEVFDVEESS